MGLKKALIPAAGLGTRFLPATKTIPKEMLPILDKPSIQYVVEEAIASGIRDIVLITSRGKTSIEDYFDVSYELEDFLKKREKRELWEMVQRISQMINLISVRQKNPFGLGHAILCARETVGGEYFAVLLPDDLIEAEIPCLKQMMEIFEKYQSPIIAIQPVLKRNTALYGIIKAEELSPGIYKIEDMVEKPLPEEAPSNLAIVGRYILPPEIFEILENTKPNKNGEIQLTDALLKLGQKRPIYGFKFRGERYDTGDKLGYLKASIIYGLKDPSLGPELKSFLREIRERDE